MAEFELGYDYIRKIINEALKEASVPLVEIDGCGNYGLEGNVADTMLMHVVDVIAGNYKSSGEFWGEKSASADVAIGLADEALSRTRMLEEAIEDLYNAYPTLYTLFPFVVRAHRAIETEVKVAA